VKKKIVFWSCPDDNKTMANDLVVGNLGIPQLARKQRDYIECNCNAVCFNCRDSKDCKPKKFLLTISVEDCKK
jgi:hypothetical protein